MNFESIGSIGTLCLHVCFQWVSLANQTRRKGVSLYCCDKHPLPTYLWIDLSRTECENFNIIIHIRIIWEKDTPVQIMFDNGQEKASSYHGVQLYSALNKSVGPSENRTSALTWQHEPTANETALPKPQNSLKFVLLFDATDSNPQPSDFAGRTIGRLIHSGSCSFKP